MKKYILFIAVIAALACNKEKKIEDNCCKEKAFWAQIDTAFVKIPNVFTPNGDGLNDVYYPVLKNISSFSIKVFNKKDEVIYESTSLSNTWDGKHSGGKWIGQIIDGQYKATISATTTSGQSLSGDGQLTIFSKAGDQYCVNDISNCLCPDGTNAASEVWDGPCK